MDLVGSIVDVKYHISVLPNELRLVYRPYLLDRKPRRNRFQGKFHIIIADSFVEYNIRYQSPQLPDGIVYGVYHDTHRNMMMSDVMFQKLNYFRILFGNQV